MIVRFSGFGGQGIILIGYIYGASAIHEGKNVVQTQSYGSAARGGACKSDVLISDTEIYELSPTELDILVSMSQVAYDKFIPKLKKDGILIIDNDMVSVKNQDYKLYGLPATDIAYKKFGKKIVGNMVMMGFMTAVTGLISKDVVENSILENVPKGTGKVNVEGFQIGYDYGINKY